MQANQYRHCAAGGWFAAAVALIETWKENYQRADLEFRDLAPYRAGIHCSNRSRI
jgi:hypothetical protein